jgi:hypothetical protein
VELEEIGCEDGYSDVPGSGWGPVAGSCGRDKESASSVKAMEFLE